MQLSMACGERVAGLSMETAVNKKFLKTSSLLTSDFTAPLDPADLTSSTHSYDERTTFWALTEDQRQHAHNHSAHLCRYASSKALRSRSALLRAQTWRARCMRVALCRWRLELPWSPQLKSWTKGTRASAVASPREGYGEWVTVTSRTISTCTHGRTPCYVN